MHSTEIRTAIIRRRLRLEACIKKLDRVGKERLAAGDPELTAELLGGLSETLDQKKKRLRKEAREEKEKRAKKETREKK